ncbi:MAG: hypothetical protein K2X01_05380 [Cyanobacteria bacterium]|nr:hypothetical protein [Cyanobacteriota bacterium]
MASLVFSVLAQGLCLLGVCLLGVSFADDTLDMRDVPPISGKIKQAVTNAGADSTNSASTPMAELRLVNLKQLLAAEKKNLIGGITQAENTSDNLPSVMVLFPAAKWTESWNGWQPWLAYLKQQEEAHSQYHIYLLRYNPVKGRQSAVKELQQQLHSFLEQHPLTRLRFLAQGEAGLVLYDLLEDQAIRGVSDRTVFIGSPFHGTPLASAQWTKDRAWVFSPNRLWLAMEFGAARQHYPQFEQELCWDNFDRSLSDRLPVTGKIPICEPRALDERRLDKAVMYASYFGLSARLDHYLREVLNLPEDIPTRDRAILFGSNHWTIAQTQQYLERLRLKGQTDMGDQVPMMAYNDGRTPIASSLWLGRFAARYNDMNPPQERVWQALRQLKNNDQARLFPGVDYRDWQLGSTRTGNPRVRDVLNPTEPMRTVFDWLWFDLTR